MKVAVIGNGKVGKAVFRELQGLRKIDELVLVGRNGDACQAEAEDYLDALPLRLDRPSKVYGGDYSLTRGADILVYCAGPSITEEERLSIAETNIKVMKEVFGEIDKYAPDAIVICVTNPLDIITTAIQKLTNRPPERVIGTGTLLDTARLIKIVSWMLDLPMDDVNGYVIGEHGGSSVVLNSSINIMGMNIEDYIEYSCDGVLPMPEEVMEKELEEDVRDAGFKIFRAKGYTSAGVAAAATRIVYDIINNTDDISPVSTVLSGEYGVEGFAISVPCSIGRKGISKIRKIRMSDDERDKFSRFAQVIRDQCLKAGLL